VLYSDHSDILAEHLPSKRFLVESWRQTGEMPLWCPYSFGGSPFVHDIQVAAFYPPHLVLYVLPVDRVGAGLSWLIVAHLIVAGWCAYAYARSQGLGTVAALVAAMGYMFAGRWLLHLLGAGHYITIGLTWLPLVLVCLERAIRRNSFLWATAAGLSFALIVLCTQPQWTLYGGVFVALWSLGAALVEAGYLDGVGERSRQRTAKALARWIGYGTWAVVLAVAVAAIQLLPTLEAAGHSTRAAGVDAGDVLDSGVRALLFLVGPALTTEPANLVWEDRGGLGLVWLIAAALAPLLAGKRIRYQASVCLALVLFALGGALAFQWLPGFRLFRQPARMLVVAAFPIAYLAGVTTQALFAGPAPSPLTHQRCRGVMLRIVLAVGILTGGFAIRLVVQGQDIRPHFYWLTLLLTIPAAFWLLGPRSVERPTLGAAAWFVILLIDLWALTKPLVDVRPEEEIYAASSCVQSLIHATPGRMLDRDADEVGAGTPLGAGAPLAMRHRLESLRGYNPLDHRRFKEYLQLVSENDESLRPFAGPLAYPVIGNFPIRNKGLLDLLGTRYLVQPSDWPLEQEGWRLVVVDAHPTGFDFVAGGTHALPSYSIYENEHVFPRAFVVHCAASLPLGPDTLPALKATDFKREVLLEEYAADQAADSSESPYWTTTIREYQPNRVIIDAVETAAGWLVLTDVWYPGWTCTVDGEPVEVYRANYLFRAIHVDAGRHEVVFRFEPQSYRSGRIISLGTLGLVAVLGLIALAGKLWAHRQRPGFSAETQV
jgi:hypothetical protein